MAKGYKGYKGYSGGYGYSSSWGWEDSYFGGYYSVLDRYPRLKVSSKIDFNIKDSKASQVGSYTHEKLVKIFLHRVNELGIQNKLITGITRKSETTRNFLGIKEEKEFLEISESAIDSCVKRIVEAKDEFCNLIDYFAPTLKLTSLRIPLEFEDDESQMMELLTVKPSNPIIMDALSGDHKLNAVVYLSEENKNTYRRDSMITSHANKLAAMLDISYDPKSDRVNNLRAGKLDGNKLVEASCGNPNIYYQTVENQSTKPFSICILGDESGSMSGDKLRLQRDVIKILWECFRQVLPPEKIFVYGHTSEMYDPSTKLSEENSDLDDDDPDWKERPVIHVYNEPSSLTFEDAIEYMTSVSTENNYDGPAIEIAYERVRQATDDNILFISLSDGQPHGVSYGGKPAKTDMKRIIEKLRRDKFVTAGIGIQDTTVKEMYPNYVVLYDLSSENVAANISRLLNHIVKTEFQ